MGRFSDGKGAVKAERFAIFEAIPNRVVPLGRVTLEEAKDVYRGLRSCFPNETFYLVRLDPVDASCQIQKQPLADKV